MLRSLHKNLAGTGGVTLLAALASAPASAALSDTIHPYIGTSYAYDDNLFRVDDSIAVGEKGRSDYIKTVVAGVQLDRPVGRQRFTANVKVSKVTFDKYDELDYNGKNADFNWYWKLGNHWSGVAGVAYNQTLTPFSDFHSSERNLRIDRSKFVEANWLFHPSWRAHGKVVKREFQYELSSQKYLDRDERTGEFGIDYLASSGSSIGLLTRRSQGEYPYTVSYLGIPLNESYTQREYKLAATWLISALTRIDLEAGHARRSHDSSVLRDNTASSGRLTATWSPRNLLKFTGAAWREFAPYEGSLLAYSLNTGGSVGATWTPGYKLQVDAQLQSVKRDFSVVLPGIASGYADRTNNATLGLTYAWRDNISLGASVFREMRKIDRIYGSPYRANGASLTANLQF